MPLAFFRLGLFAAVHRRSLGRGLLLVAAAVLVVPVLMALLVTSAVANLPLPSGVPARPMTTWRVSQVFGCTGLAFEPARGSCAHFHSGIDLAGPLGGPVYSVLPGVVEVLAPSGYGGGYGIHVVVHHDGATLTMYAHLLTALVRSGDRVAGGELLGYEGSTGLSTGPHLHFELRRVGAPIDPAAAFPSLFGPSAVVPTGPPVGVLPRPN